MTAPESPRLKTIEEIWQLKTMEEICAEPIARIRVSAPPVQEPPRQDDKPKTLGAMARLAASIPSDGRSVKMVNHEAWEDFTQRIEVEIGPRGSGLLRVLAVILVLVSLALAAISLR